jgi:dihydroorotase
MFVAYPPARLFGIAGKGRIAAGYDADFTIVDLKRQSVIINRCIASRCGRTPYEGMSVLGWPLGTIIRGRGVMCEGGACQRGAGSAGALRAGVVTVASGVSGQILALDRFRS